MASDYNLKPCPYCGSLNISVDYDSGLAESVRPAYFAVCRDCNARGPARPTDDGAISAWSELVAVSKAETTTVDAPEDATIEGIVRSIFGWTDKAKSHTKDEYVLGCLGQIANWAKSLTDVVSKTETITGDVAKMREAIERIRSEAYECDQGGEYLGEGSDPGFDRIVKLCDAALAATEKEGGNNADK